jgi:hypothetical protein
VTSVDRELDATDSLGGLRTRLAVLARDATHTHHRLARDHLHDAGEHIEQSRLAGHVTRRALRRVLRAVSRLHHMRLSGSDSGEHRPQRPQGSGIHERRTRR